MCIFQSQNGLILTLHKCFTIKIFKRISIPKWSDFNEGKMTSHYELVHISIPKWSDFNHTTQQYNY